MNNYAVINLAKAHLIYYPCPLNINFLWNYGFLLGIMFFTQIITGVLLASHYTADTSSAYYSVQHILRELWGGWLFRYLHANGASFVFITLYLHLLRGLNYSFSYLPLTWVSGVIIFILSIMIAFMGYVLPWGQMSFWGATVITNLLDIIPSLVNWICGGFLVDNPTLKRFFVLHFVLPFVVLTLVFVHIYYLHLQGSTNPLGYDTNLKIPFYPNLLYLDLKGLNYLIAIFLIQSTFGIYPLSHPDNAIQVNILATPLHIVPEWYLLSYYAMLKSIPNKTSGLLVMVGALLSLILLSERRNMTSIILFRFIYSCRDYTNPVIWLLCSFYALGCIGHQLPQDTFIFFGRIYIIIYFVCVLSLLVPSRRIHYDYSSQANI